MVTRDILLLRAPQQIALALVHLFRKTAFYTARQIERPLAALPLSDVAPQASYYVLKREYIKTQLLNLRPGDAARIRQERYGQWRSLKQVLREYRMQLEQKTKSGAA